MSNETNGDLKDSSFNLATQDSSYFSDFVTVISGARQTANQEFNRFWEKFGLNKGTNYTPTTASSTQITSHTSISSNRKMMPYKKTQNHRQDNNSFISTLSNRNKSDIARMRNGQDIYGRIIPDTNRRGYIKDAEIQTDDFMAEEGFSTITASLSSSTTDPLHQSTVETKQNDAVVTYTNKRKASSILRDSNDILYRPQKMLKTDSSPSKTSSPIRAAAIKLEISSSKQPFNYTENEKEVETRAVKQSPSTRHLISSSSPLNLSPSIRSSPERKNSIVTGSTKSVKRLTSELEETFSPRFPPHPYLSTASPKRLFHTSTAPSEDSGANAASDNSSSSNNQDPFLSTPLNIKTTPSTTISSVQSRLLLTQDEEDERMAQLERKVVSIQSQIKDFVSYPSSIKSPKPSHTVSSIINHIEEITPSESSGSNTMLPSPVRNINTRSIIHTKTSPPSYKSNGTSSSLSRVPPPPAAPSAPTVMRSTFSPIRDIPFRYQNASPIIIKDQSPNSYTAINDEHKMKLFPNALKPNDKHKQKMRELIQLIPGVKLRKTDKIIGPDGTERPNPFWNEIYNPGKRRVY